MTISSSVTKNTYTGNSSAKIFAYQFRIFDEDDILVVVDGVTKTKTTDYTVSGVNNLSGGNVTFIIAPTTGQSIVLTHNLPFTQQVDYTELGAFPAESHEEALDRSVSRDLALKEIVDRTLKFNSNTAATSFIVPEPVDGNYLQWSGTSGSLINVSALAGTTNITATGTTTARTAENRFADVFNVKDFGAVGDGSADDSPAISAAFTAANTAGGGTVYFPAGTYLMETNATGNNNYMINLSGFDYIHIKGDGMFNTVIKAGDDVNLGGISCPDVNYLQITDIKIDCDEVNQSVNSKGVDGIRTERAEYIILDRVWIANTIGYGFSEGADYTEQGLKKFIMSNCIISNTSSDGMDIKNREYANADLEISNCLFFGISRNDTGSSVIDCRGAWDVSNVVIHLTETSVNGIQCRADRSGLEPSGGRYTNINNVQIFATGTGSVGFNISNEFVALNNCIVHISAAATTSIGFGFGTSVDSATGITASNCRVISDGTTNDVAFRFNSEFGTFTNLYAQGTSIGFELQELTDKSSLVNCIADACGTSFEFESSVTDTILMNCRSDGATTAGVTWAGTTQADNDLFNCVGFGTANQRIIGNDGSVQFDTSGVASAVNNVRATAATTTNTPSITAVGSDTNIDLDIDGKGTGLVNINGLDTVHDATLTIDVQDASGNSASFVTQEASYSAFGPFVGVDLRIANINTTGLTAGDRLRVTGLPFASIVNMAICGNVIFDNLATATGGQCAPTVEFGDTYIEFQIDGGTGSRTYVLVSDINSGTTDVVIGLFYRRA